MCLLRVLMFRTEAASRHVVHETRRNGVCIKLNHTCKSRTLGTGVSQHCRPQRVRSQALTGQPDERNGTASHGHRARLGTPESRDKHHGTAPVLASSRHSHSAASHRRRAESALRSQTMSTTALPTGTEAAGRSRFRDECHGTVSHRYCTVQRCAGARGFSEWAVGLAQVNRTSATALPAADAVQSRR